MTTIRRLLLALLVGFCAGAQAPDDFPFPAAIGQMWTVVYFDPLADATTRLRVVSMGFTPDAESQRMRSFFERGNAFTAKKLQEKFAK